MKRIAHLNVSFTLFFSIGLLPLFSDGALSQQATPSTSSPERSAPHRGST